MITIDPPDKALLQPSAKGALSRFLNRARAAVGLTGQIDVLLADDTTLRRLNRTYRGKNKPTDVLSFPAAEMNGAGPQPYAGDLAISLDTAALQAAEHGHTLRDEVRILLLHGTLHLAGYDHETDAGEMAEREAELRKKLRLPSGLIARNEAASLRPRTKTTARKHTKTRTSAESRRAR